MDRSADSSVAVERALGHGGQNLGLQGIRVALIWSRFGPYHLARARAAESRLRELGGSLVLAEVSSRDLYAWETAGMARPPWASTLFPGTDYVDLNSRRLVAGVRDWLDEARADVVVVNGWSVVEARAALQWVREKPSRRAVVMSETKYDESPRWFWKEWLKRKIVSAADAGLVGGRPHADYLHSLGIARERIFLGYNAVDNDYFAKGTDDWRRLQTLRGSAPFTEAGAASPYFFASSRFIARKNLDGLLRAYACYRVRAGQVSGELWPLVIAGSGEEESALRSLCSALGLDAFVHWPGFVQYETLPRWYGGAGAFIHPAICEAWGLVVNEAAASSLPLLVAAPVGARYELLEEGIGGYVFDPRSDEDMAAKMLQVSRLSLAERTAMGSAARARVDGFGPGRFADGLVSAVKAALAVRK